MRDIERMSPAKLAELLVDVSPEMSRALWDGLRMCNPGVETCLAVAPGTDKPLASAQPALDEMLATLKSLYGSPDVVYNKLFTMAFLRGDIAAELVLAPNGRDFVDIATPDPAFFTYRRQSDPLRGVVWRTGQFQGGQFVALDEFITFKHIPIDPLVGRPNGRAPFTSALFISVFLMGLLFDLKRVIQQQGYPRLDVEVIFEKLKSQMPRDAAQNPAKLKKWADEVVARVKSVYAQLKPDDTYIHSDAIKVNTPVGALSNLSLGAIDALFKALERMATRALKTMPLLMATTDGVSEANANRQWEIHAAGIKALQHLVESLLEHIFNVALRAKGVRAECMFRFSELRAAELLRDAQVELLNATIAAMKYDRGWISQDASAQDGAGVEKADAPEPRNTLKVSDLLSSQGNDAKSENPEPGSNRASAEERLRTLAFSVLFGTLETGTRAFPTSAQIERANEFWKTFAPAVAQGAPTAPSVSA